MIGLITVKLTYKHFQHTKQDTFLEEKIFKNNKAEIWQNIRIK